MIRKTLGKFTNQARETYFGFQGELVYDLLTNNLYIMDGQHAGGHLLSEVMLPDNAMGYLANDGEGNLVWQNVNISTSQVESVAGRTGNVVLTVSDISGLSNVAISGSYLDLTNIPLFATVASSGNYSDLNNIPVFSNVAITGSYTDLINTPNVFIDLNSVNQDIIPSQDVTYNLGNSTNQWHSVYVGPGSVYIGNVKLTNSNGALVTTQISIDPTTGNETIINNNTVIADKLTSNIYVASLDPDMGTFSLPGGITVAHDSQYNIGNSATGFNAIHANTIKSRSAFIIDAGSTYSFWYNLFGDLSNEINYDFGMSSQYDSGGNLVTFGEHFAGGFGSGGTIDTLALKYNPEGDLLWRKSWVTPAGNPCGSSNVDFKIGANDEIFWISAEEYGSGSAPNFCYAGTTDTNGVISNSAVLINNVVVYSMTLSNNVPVIVGQGTANGTALPFIAQINIGSYSLDWSNTLQSDANGYFVDIAVDSSGNLQVLGAYTDPDTNIGYTTLYKINPANGNVLDSYTLSGSAVVYPNPKCINCDASGNTYTAIDCSSGYVLTKWDSDLNTLWSTQYTDGFNISQILFDSNQTPYITGQNSNTILVAEIDPSSGALVWQLKIQPQSGYLGPFEYSIRSADIYSDRMGITALFTINPLDGNETITAFTCQIPLDGSITGTHGQFIIIPTTFSATIDVDVNRVTYGPTSDFTSYYDTQNNQFVPDTILHDTGEWPYRQELKGGKLNQSSWQFTTAGQLIAPNGGIFGPPEGNDASGFGLQITPNSAIYYTEINYKNDQYFYMSSNGVGIVSNAQQSGHEWTFDNSGTFHIAGNIQFTDNTVQSTAWTGITNPTSNLVNNSWTVSLDSTGNLSVPKNITMTRGSYITSQPGYVGDPIPIANISVESGNLVVVTTENAHNLSNNTKIEFENIETTTDLNGNSYYVGNVTSTTLTLYTDTNLNSTLDGGSLTPYNTLSNRTVTETGVTYSTNGPFNTGALAFDGTQWLTINNAGLTSDGDFTAECWVYSTTGFVYDGIFDLNGTITMGTDNSGNLWFRDGGGNFITGPSMDPNTWYHIAVVRSGSTVNFYFNGTYFHSSGNSDTITGDFTFGLGVIGSGQKLRGYMTGIRFSDIARYSDNFTPATSHFTSDSDTLLLLNTLASDTAFTNAGTLGGTVGNQQTVNGMTANPPSNSTGIANPTSKLDLNNAAYIPNAFSIPVGANVAVSGTDNFTDTVTLVESPTGETRFDLFFTLANHSGPFTAGDTVTFTWQAPAPTFILQTPYSILSGSMDMHAGTLGFANAQDFATGTQPFTFETWFYANSWNSFAPIFQASTPFQIQISNTEIFDGYGSTNIGYTLNTNQWYYLTIVRSGNFLKAWINGQTVFDVSYSQNLTYDSTLPAGVGIVDGSSSYFDGLISNLRFVNGTALYSADTIDVPTSPLGVVGGTKLLLTSATSGGYYSDASNSMLNPGGGDLVAEYKSGDLTLEAGAITTEDAGNINIISGSNSWIFNGSTGGLIFPDNTVQYTATDLSALQTDFVGLKLNDSSANVYIGSPGDRQGTIKIDGQQRSYISTKDYVGDQSTTTVITVTTIEDVTTGQTGGKDTVVFDYANYSNIQAIVGNSLQYFVASEWTVQGPSLAGTYALVNAGVGVDGQTWSFYWTHHSGDPDPVTTGTVFTLTHTGTPRNPEIWKQIVTGSTWDNNFEKISDIAINSSQGIYLNAGNYYNNDNVVAGGSIGIFSGGGNATSGSGTIWVTAANGSATGSGGDVAIWAGSGGYFAGHGGNVYISSGSASGSDNPGAVYIGSGQGSGNTTTHTATAGGGINIASGTGAHILYNQSIENIFLENPVRIQITNHNLTTGQKIYVVGITTTTELNGYSYYISVQDANNILLYHDSTLRRQVLASGLTPYQTSPQYTIGFQNVLSGATNSFGIFSNASADLVHIDTTWTVSGDTIGNNVPITGITTYPNGGGAGITLYIIDTGGGSHYFDQGYGFVLNSAITSGGGTVSAATNTGDIIISTNELTDPLAGDNGRILLTGKVYKNFVPLETADSNWQDPNSNTWGIRTYNSGTAFSFDPEAGPHVWWDAQNIPASPATWGTGFHGAIIEYQANIQGSVYGNIIGTIHISTQGVGSPMPLTHTEAIDGYDWPNDTSFWIANGYADTCQLLFATDRSCNVRIMWTARVFYQEENFC